VTDRPSGAGTAASWVESAAGSGFDVDHLPFGVFVLGDDAARVGVRVGQLVLDLRALTAAGLLDGGPLFSGPSLSPFLAAGPQVWAAVRDRLTELLTSPVHARDLEPLLVPIDRVRLELPFEVADYVDFYASLDHATNVGKIFRPDAEPLTPNWRHLPIGYHGRAGTVVVSGTEVVRPSGQRKAPADAEPTFGPSRRLDIEAELGFVVGVPSRQGDRVATGALRDHVFGVVLLNDWSARDVQAWEYVPLGPFLGKSFATSIAGWVTPMAALDASRAPLPDQVPAPLEYLRVSGDAGYDLTYEIVVNGEVVSRPPYATMYWSPAQMLAHLTANGASLRTGDLFASGTISGPGRDQRGSLLELSWGGQEPFSVAGAQRTFLEDGDEVTLRATARGRIGPVTLGEVTGRILPAR
jgi:fumarylacetoacetase